MLEHLSVCNEQSVFGLMEIAPKKKLCSEIKIRQNFDWDEIEPYV